jgi:cyclo(L-tyrosyl-L-tyrosyl) synthase
MEIAAACPLTSSCSRVFARGQHGLLGISALNGYFSQATITQLPRRGIDRFAGVGGLLPGEELECTLRVPEGAVGGKARAAVGNARNPISRLPGRRQSDHPSSGPTTIRSADCPGRR